MEGRYENEEILKKSKRGGLEEIRSTPFLCSGRGSNPYGHFCPRDFKSLLSTNSNTRASGDKDIKKSGASEMEKKENCYISRM